MNTVLVRRNDENLGNERDDLSSCRRIVVKVKRKNSFHIDTIKCDELQRSALGNLNNAANGQAFVHLSKKGGSTRTKVVIGPVSNRSHYPAESNVQLCTKSAKETTTFENIERRTHKSEATAMTTTSQRNDKLCQYPSSMNMLHQQSQQRQNRDWPVFQNEWLLQTKIVTRALARVPQHNVHVDTSNGCSVAIPNNCHAANGSSADVNVLQTSESGLKSVPDDLYVEHTIRSPFPILNAGTAKRAMKKKCNLFFFFSAHVAKPSIELTASSKSQQAIKATENISPENVMVQINDYDAECARDPCHEPEYAAGIFNYFKEREKKFKIGDYMRRQSSVTTRMRADLIDWMASTQEFFALNLETLFLAVKLVDLILNRSDIKKETLQLLGAAAFLLAAKFEV